MIELDPASRLLNDTYAAQSAQERIEIFGRTRIPATAGRLASESTALEFINTAKAVCKDGQFVPQLERVRTHT